MISLEQIQKLENRVRDAVSVVRTFKEENRKLHARIADLEEELNTLRTASAISEADAAELEAGFQGVFAILDEVGNEDVGTASSEVDTSSSMEEPIDSDKSDSVTMEDSTFITNNTGTASTDEPSETLEENVTGDEDEAESWLGVENSEVSDLKEQENAPPEDSLNPVSSDTKDPVSGKDEKVSQQHEFDIF